MAAPTARACDAPCMRRLRWLGHATVELELDGARLLTDPVLRSRLMHLRRQGPAPSPPVRPDAVLVSHVHHDHLDRGSLRAVAGPGVAVVVPAGAGELVSGLGFGAVHEVVAGDRLTFGGVEVAVAPAWHPARRHPRARELPALGYLAAGIWFAGDTDLHDDMAALRESVDVALLPVWGWGPTLGPGHLDPAGAARAVALVQPRVAIPIHWGTFFPIGLARRYSALLRDPPVEFAAQVAAGAPSTEVVVLAPGEAFSA